METRTRNKQSLIPPPENSGEYYRRRFVCSCFLLFTDLPFPIEIPDQIPYSEPQTPQDALLAFPPVSVPTMRGGRVAVAAEGNTGVVRRLLPHPAVRPGVRRLYAVRGPARHAPETPDPRLVLPAPRRPAGGAAAWRPPPRLPAVNLTVQPSIVHRESPPSAASSRKTSTTQSARPSPSARRFTCPS